MYFGHWKRRLLFSKSCEFDWFMLCLEAAKMVSEIRNAHRRLQGCSALLELRGQESLLRLQTLKFRGLYLCMQTGNKAQIHKFCKCWFFCLDQRLNHDGLFHKGYNYKVKSSS